MTESTPGAEAVTARCSSVLQKHEHRPMLSQLGGEMHLPALGLAGVKAGQYSLQ